MKKKPLQYEDIITELIKITSGLADVAQDYHSKMGDSEQLLIIMAVYQRIINRLLELKKYDENSNETVTLEEIVHNTGLSFIGETK